MGKKNDVKLFGANVLIDCRKKKTIKLHLPETAKEENRDLFEFVVVRVGPKCELGLKENDLIIPMHLGQHQIVSCDVGYGQKNYFMVNENQITGVQILQ